MERYILKKSKNGKIELLFLDQHKHILFENESEYKNSEYFDPSLTIRKRSELKTLDIALTSSCNLRCKHCYWGNRLGKIFLDLDLLKQIFDDALELGVTNIVLTGGEIFTHPQIKEILTYIAGKFRIILVTNGTLISDFIDFLRSLPIYEITVSLDGFKEEHETIRGFSWDEVVNNIRKLLDSGFYVRLNAIFSKKLSEHWKEFYDWAKNELGVKAVTFLPISVWGNAKENQEIVEYKKLRDVVQTLPVSDDPFCHPGYKRLAIGFDGFVYPCQYFREIEYYKIGNVFNKSLKTIYELNEKYNFVQNYRNVECEKCVFYDKCKGGCRGRAMVYHYSFSKNDEFMTRILFDKPYADMFHVPENPLYTLFFEDYIERYQKPEKVYESVLKILKEIDFDTIIELGPGSGDFYNMLKTIKRDFSYVGIEKSEKFCNSLKNRFGKNENFKIINEDVLSLEKINADVVVALYSFFNHFQRKVDVESIIKKIKAKVFIFDFGEFEPNTTFNIKSDWFEVKGYNDGHYTYSFYVFKKEREYWYAMITPLITENEWKKLLKSYFDDVNIIPITKIRRLCIARNHLN